MRDPISQPRNLSSDSTAHCLQRTSFTLWIVILSLVPIIATQSVFQSNHPEFGFYLISDHQNMRSERSVTDDRTRACMMFIGIDDPLWIRYDRNMSAVTQLAQDHVEMLNKIYIEQVFDSGTNTDRYFRLAKLQIMFGSCDGFKDENCTTKREDYLRMFYKSIDTSEFCLAYIFTYIDFHNDTAGLASVGTACRKTQNSGFITLLNNGYESDLESSSLTFAHEVGHNFGANHDQEFADSECNKTTFIMSEISSSGGVNQTNRLKFSNCSLESIRKTLSNLESKVDDVEDCFISLPAKTKKPEVVVSLCGNGVVEPGEACDCGDDDQSCNDVCCYPAHISDYDRSVNESAKFCQTNQKSSCVTPRPLIFGFYLPLFLIGVIMLVFYFVLRHDWNGRKHLFTHITQGQVRIVKTSP